MKQVGIIYKFTILAKYKFDGHQPFYVGQHFGLDDFDTYPGSVKIWEDFINRMKKDFPTCWRKLIKREVLYQRPCSQIALDAMEAYYIKKEQSHYSYHKGGCNILWGTANNFGSGSPMKDPKCRKKQSESLKKFYKENKHPCLGKKASEELKIKLSISHKGYKHDDSVIKRISEKNKGKRRTEEFSQKMKDVWKDRKRSGWVSPIKNKSVDEETRIKRAEGVRKYYSENQSFFKGKTHSESAKQKISKAMTKRQTGKKFSEETKKKMKESAKRAWKIRKQNIV